MKALMFDQLGPLQENLNLVDIDTPEPGPKQVLVKVMASPVNPSDFMYASGNYRFRPQLPAIAGLEGSGLIVAAGRDLADLPPGTHVAFRARGVWADYCLVDADKLHTIDGNLSFVDSAQLTLNALTAYALLDELRLQPGDNLLLNAAGSSVAFLIIQLALQRQIKIVALVNPGTDTGYFPQTDALTIIRTDAKDQVQEALAATQQQAGFEGFLDAVGGSALSDFLPAMAPFGKILLYGNLSNGIAGMSSAMLIYRNLSVTGFGIDYWREQQTPERLQEIISGLAKQVAGGTLKLKPVTTVSLHNWTEGLQRLAAGNTKLVWINEENPAPFR